MLFPMDNMPYSTSGSFLSNTESPSRASVQRHSVAPLCVHPPARHTKGNYICFILVTNNGVIRRYRGLQNTSFISRSLPSLSVFFSAASDCVMSEWSEWSECSKSCGKGHMMRTRVIKLEPQFGGEACPEIFQRKKCKIRKCNQGGTNSDERKKRKEARQNRKTSQGREEWTDELAGEGNKSYIACCTIAPLNTILQHCLMMSFLTER